MAIDYSRFSKREPFFAFWDATSNRVLHFASERIEAYCRGVEWPIQTIALTPELVTAVALQNGIEPHHLATIDERHLNAPCTLADMEDGFHVVIDGNHRLIRRAQLGFDTIEAYVVPKRIWERFLIANFPGADEDWAEHLRAANGQIAPGQRPA